MNKNDIENILHEPDGQELYAMATEVKQSYEHQHRPTEVDVEAQWKKFAATHQKTKRPNWRKVAATILLLIGLTALALTIPAIYLVKDATPEGNTMTGNTINAGQEVVKEAFVFDDVPLEQVLSEMADYYGAEVVFSDASRKEIRLYTQLDKHLSLQEAIALLNHLEHLKLRLEDGPKIVVE